MSRVFRMTGHDPDAPVDDVEIEVATVAASGSPGVRSAVRMDAITLTADTSAAADVDTADRVSFPTPTSALEDGAGLQTFRARIYVEGGGSLTGAPPRQQPPVRRMRQSPAPPTLKAKFEGREPRVRPVLLPAALPTIASPCAAVC